MRLSKHDQAARVLAVCGDVNKPVGFGWGKTCEMDAAGPDLRPVGGVWKAAKHVMLISISLSHQPEAHLALGQRNPTAGSLSGEGAGTVQPQDGMAGGDRSTGRQEAPDPPKGSKGPGRSGRVASAVSFRSRTISARAKGGQPGQARLTDLVHYAKVAYCGMVRLG